MTEHRKYKAPLYQYIKVLKHMTISKINNGYILQVEYEGDIKPVTLAFDNMEEIVNHLCEVNVQFEVDLITNQSYRITELQKRIEKLEKSDDVAEIGSTEKTD